MVTPPGTQSPLYRSLILLLLLLLMLLLAAVCYMLLLKQGLKFFLKIFNTLGNHLLKVLLNKNLYDPWDQYFILHMLRLFLLQQVVVLLLLHP